MIDPDDPNKRRTYLTLVHDGRKPPTLWHLHSSLMHMLCVRHLLEFVLDIEDCRRDLDFDGSAGKLRYELTQKTSRKRPFTFGMPAYRVSLSNGEFMEDLNFAQDLWFGATDADRAKAFRGSWADLHGLELLEAIKAHGFKAGQRKPPPTVGFTRRGSLRA